MRSAQQQATKRYRERRRKRGLKRVEVQVPGAEIAVIRKAASILREQEEEAAKLRALLGFAPGSRRPASALDMFAMSEPLSPEGEALWDDVMSRVERERRDPNFNRTRDVEL